MPGLGIFDSPSQVAEGRGMGLFAPPSAPGVPEPAPPTPERAEPAPPTPAAPAPPTPAPAPAPERPARPRRPRREPETFEGDEQWQAFLDAKYQGGRARVEHPDPRQRRRRRNMDEPRIRFNTGMNYENFRQQVAREFEAWKQQQQQAPAAEPHYRPSDLGVGDPVRHIDQLREGDVLENINGAVIRVVGINDDRSQLRYQWRREDGTWSARTRSLSPHVFPNRSYTLKEREVPDAAPPDEPAERRVEVGGMVDDVDQLRPGDVIQNEWLENHNQARKILEIREDGSLLTQRFNTQTGENEGAPTVISGEQVRREGEAYDHFTQYKRIPAEAESEEGRPGEAPAGEPEAERLKVGDKVERPDQLRVGDIFQNDYLRDSMDDKRRLVVSVRDGQVKTRLVMPNGEFAAGDTPSVLTQDFLDSHGPYTVLAAVGTRVERPRDAGVGTYIQAEGKPLLRVSATAGDHLLVQVVSVDTGRPVGRPTKITGAELEEIPYKVAPAPSRIESRSGDGLSLTRPRDFREGEIVKILHEEKPIWAKVTAKTSRSVTLKPMNPRTGRPAREAAQKFTAADLGEWADVRRSQNIPARLQPPPPPIEAPEGGFARPGAGELTPNRQTRRYDHVRFNLGRSEAETRRNLARLLGDAAEGKDPVHVAADLAGAGGLAKSARSITITAEGNTISVKVSGNDIVSMERYLYFENGRPSYISNSYFKLAGSAADAMGLKAFASQVAAARDAGFRQISVNAAGSHANVDSDGRFIDGDLVGYWVWPRFGYDAGFPHASFNRMPPAIKEAILRIKPGAPAGLTFLDVFSSGPEAREWWKHNGTGRGMTFELGPESRSLKYLTEYVREKAQMRDQGADEFLNRAARLRERMWLRRLERVLAAAEKVPKKTLFDEPDEENEGGRVEVPQPMTDKDIEISDSIFDRMGDEMRKENEKKGESPGGKMTEHDKKATAAVADLAKKNREFRTALVREILGAHQVRDFAIDQFSQVALLTNLRAGDKVDISYRPGERPEPMITVERLVQTDFDPVIRGVTLQTPTGAEGVLVDKGEPQGILYWDGPNTPGYAVTKLGLGRSKLAQEDKATAAQVQFALDLAKEKGKDYSKSDLQKKTKAEISKMIEGMQGEANVASDKQVAYALSLLNEAGRKSPSKASLEKMPEADVSKLIDELKAKGDKKANSLLESLGGHTRLAAMVGARNVDERPDGLSFEWTPRAAARGNKVAVEVGDCGYRVTFLLKTAKGERQIRRYEGVTPDQLVDVFERQTGLFLRL